MFCTQCGTKLTEGAAFCHGCGARAPSGEQAASQEPAQAPASAPGGAPPSRPADLPPAAAAPAVIEPPTPDFLLRDARGAPAPPVHDPFGEPPPEELPPTEPPAVAAAPPAAHGTPVTQQAIPDAPAAGFAPDAWQAIVAVLVIVGGVLAIVGSFVDWIDRDQIFVSINGFDMGYLTSPIEGDGQDGLLSLIAGVIVAAAGLHYFFLRNVWASLGIFILGLAIAALGTYNMTRLIYEAKRDLDISTSTAFDLIGTGIYLTIAGGALAAVGSFAGAWRTLAR